MTPQEQKAYAEPKDKRTTQQKHFDNIYNVFFKFYQEKLAGDLPPHERVRLLRTTQFFDDLDIQALVHPLFSSFPTTVAEKQACARMAFYDALTIHNRLAGLQLAPISEKELHEKGL